MSGAAEALAKIDEAMERASVALAARRYFEAERLCVEAMGLAHQRRDYERMARICLPLQEARRQKRQLALDAGEVFVIDQELPAKPKPGLYLVRPPRVGLDGRMLREMADEAEVPVVVVVREPRTRAGLWPVVALGPITLRTRVEPPAAPVAETGKGKKGSKAGAAGPAGAGGAAGAGRPRKAKAAEVDPDLVVPDAEWFLWASEALGDAGIARVDPARPVASRVDELWLGLQAQPDHEKLHQALAEACAEARRLGPAALEPEVDGDEDEEADFTDSEDDGEDLADR
jgi:hypothetical protein